MFVSLRYACFLYAGGNLGLCSDTFEERFWTKLSWACSMVCWKRPSWRWFCRIKRVFDSSWILFFLCAWNWPSNPGFAAILSYVSLVSVMWKGSGNVVAEMDLQNEGKLCTICFIWKSIWSTHMMATCAQFSTNLKQIVIYIIHGKLHYVMYCTIL